MHPDSMILHPTRTAVRRAESKLLRPFADFQFRPWTQPVPSTQRFGKNHSSEFVQFELHIVALSHITLAMATCHWNSYSHRIPLAWLRQPVNLRCQDEIRLGQAIHRVGPGRDLDLAPSQQDVGM